MKWPSGLPERALCHPISTHTTCPQLAVHSLWGPLWTCMFKPLHWLPDQELTSMCISSHIYQEAPNQFGTCHLVWLFWWPSLPRLHTLQTAIQSDLFWTVARVDSSLGDENFVSDKRKYTQETSCQCFLPFKLRLEGKASAVPADATDRATWIGLMAFKRILQDPESVNVSEWTQLLSLFFEWMMNSLPLETGVIQCSAG